jgi:3-oxoadipate enol-lactonase
MPGLVDHFRVVRYDLRGHGASPAPEGPYEISDLGGDLLALLDRTEIPRAHLCGVSIGGMVSMWVAANAPERVDRLVLCNTSAHFIPPDTWVQRAATVRAHGSGAVAVAQVERWFTPGYARRNPVLLDRMHKMIAATPAEGYAACCGLLERTDLHPCLGDIRAPTLVIAGAGDPAAPPDHAERIARGIRDARVVVVPDSTHMAHIEQAAAVNELIRAHLSPDPS